MENYDILDFIVDGSKEHHKYTSIIISQGISQYITFKKTPLLKVEYPKDSYYINKNFIELYTNPTMYYDCFTFKLGFKINNRNLSVSLFDIDMDEEYVNILKSMNILIQHKLDFNGIVNISFNKLLQFFLKG